MTEIAEMTQTIDLPEEAEELKSTIGSVESKLQAIETFVARRFDEISMEINATSQQVDMAEDGITKSFADILKILATVSYSGAGNTAANTGAELNAIVNETEQAANTILSAAERIKRSVDGATHGRDEEVFEKLRQNVSYDVQHILMACSFQDLTGQRVNTALANIREIEEKLNALFEEIGIDIKPSEEDIEEEIGDTSSQDDIDALFD